jgi:Domain of unknown function (DUF4333)
MTRTLGIRIGAAVFVGAAALQLAACGSPTIKPDGAAQSVVDLVSEKTDFKPTDVKCPDGIEAKVGQEFDCKFTGPDGNYTAHMKVLKIDGEQVLFDINTKRVG